MLHQVEVENFQSLSKLTIELSHGLTVLVGPSSSGKSAVLRAIRTLVRNTSSTAAVSAGAKTFSLAAVMSWDKEPETGVAVALERGKSTSTYGVNSPSEAWAFPKAGVKVPEEIEAILAMPLIEGQDLNFGFQFDRPFLLSDPPTVAAQVLGSLTNVTQLQRASQEANRRKLEASRLLNLRKQDLTAVTEQLQPYAGLPTQLMQLSVQREVFTDLQKRAEKVVALREAAQAVTTLAKALQATQDVLSAPDPYAGLPALLAKGAAFSQLRQAASEWHQLDKARAQALADSEAAAKLAETADSEYHTLLVEAGQCPTCNQPTGNL